MRGDMNGARAFTAALPDLTARAGVTEAAVRDWNQGWAVDSLSRRYAMRRLRTSSLAHYYSLALTDAWLAHDTRAQAALADSAIRAFRERLDLLPREERLRMQLAFAYALGGRCAPAITQGDSAHATRSIRQDGFVGAGISVQMAELLAFCGQKERAIALSDTLLTLPGLMTPGWLRIDPYFASLRADSRFQALLGR